MGCLIVSSNFARVIVVITQVVMTDPVENQRDLRRLISGLGLCLKSNQNTFVNHGL